MIETIISFIEGVLVPFGALGVFAASFIEEVIAPIPSALVLLTSGFIFLHGVPLSFAFFSKLIFTIVIPASLGMTLGSLFIYGLGYVSGKPAILRFGRYLGVTWKDVETAENRLSGTSADEWGLFILRVIPVVPNVAIAAFCGLVRFSVSKYIVISVAGLSLRAFGLALVGALAGSFYDRYTEYLDQIEKIILVGFAILALAFIFILYARRRRKV